MDSNGTYIAVGATGTTKITIYDESFNILQSLTTANTIVNMCMDPATGNLYVGQNATTFEVVRANNSSNVWTFDNQYTSTAFPITQPRGIAYFNSNVIVANYEDAKLYIWSGVGEPSSTVLLEYYLFPNAMGLNNKSLCVAYDTSTSPITTIPRSLRGETPSPSPTPRSALRSARRRSASTMFRPART